MSETPMTASGSPVIQVACPTCSAQPKQRCRTKSQIEARYFHAARYEVDPAEDAETGEPLIFDSLTESYERISREVTLGQRYGKTAQVEAKTKLYTAPVDTPKPEIDPEVAELEAKLSKLGGSTYHRGLDSFLATTLVRELDEQRVRPVFRGGNKKKTDRRRAKNRVAKASRKRNRK